MMKKYLLLLVAAFPALVYAQSGMGFGVKGGVNFANVTKASSINNSSRTGFHVGVFMAPQAKKGIIGSRTELIFSRQGYNYGSGTNTGSVDLNYLVLPQYMTISISKYFQVQLGGQMAYLLNAKVDSNQTTSSNSPSNSIMKYYNRFDYGFGGGIEIHPVGGLLIGARMNISLSKMYKDPSTYASSQGSFVPKVDVKNNVFQVFAGWQFGNKKKKDSNEYD